MEASSIQSPVVKVASSATQLSLMDLNNIRLDSRHTILTPDYLEQLLAGNKPSIIDSYNK